jgi:hypothetical protein
MDFEGSGILSSILVSGVGFVFFSFGRSMKRIPQMAGGLLMMIFPYFVDGALWILLGGALLSLLIWVALRLGL